ncbi:MAG TPA: 3-isopropylmalate dehydrogenase [Gemmatimonadaceae bacterium]|jgi:3-isopropylmalate dehydrogenase|nr:3-isopropylmalate dehydrogenase [Gemmatimonadaceae bacterium]
MPALTIAVLPGDGIGPEVIAEGERVIRAVGQRWGHCFELRFGLIGGCALDARGTPLPDETVELCRTSDAVLLGAVGGPRWDDPNAKQRPEQGLLGLRKALGVYANLRPVTVHPALVAASPLRPERLEGVDFIFVRELTGGIYFGEKRRDRVNGDERAVDVCSYTTTEIERVTRIAGELARTRRKKLTSVDKANVLETSRLWRTTVSRVVREEFPDLELNHVLVDACAMELLRNAQAFDVIVTENMFGDILTDEASMLAGSLGVLPSASLGDTEVEQSQGDGDGGEQSVGRLRRGLYEPIHGSAPDIAGRGIANPVGTILSVALMLRHTFGLESEAQAVEKAVAAAIDHGCVTADIAPRGGRSYSTEEVGRAIAHALSAV